MLQLGDRMNPLHFFVAWVVSRVGVIAIDQIAHIVSFRFDALRQKHYQITLTDRVYLMINSIIETCFMVFIGTWSYRSLPILSIYLPLSLILLFVVDDILYAPYHYMLHHRLCYRYIHKKHHMVTHPARGYVHASLEHPIEMVGALILHTLSLHVLSPILDVTSIGTHIVLKAGIAMLNHTGRDVKIASYSTRPHHIHHAKQSVNYAQNVFIFDRIIGTHEA